MASNYKGNPLYIEAANDSLSYTGPAQIVHFMWGENNAVDDGTTITAGDDMHIVDKNNNTLFRHRAVANGDGMEISFHGAFPVDGISVTALDGGVCYIYLK